MADATAVGSAPRAERLGGPPLELGLVVLLPTLTTVLLLLLEPRMEHWFIVPLTLCGILTASEAARWFRPGVHPLETRALVGMFGHVVHALGPLLFVFWDQRLLFADNPPDWRPYVGAGGILCVAGWTLYLLTLAHVLRRPLRPLPARWVVDERALLPVAGVATVLGIAAHAAFVRVAGASLTAGGLERFQAVQGLGVLLPLGETVPIVLFLTVLHLLRARMATPARGRWVAATLAAFVVLQFVFAGLRGSRSAMLVPTFWALAAMRVGGVRLRKGPLVVAVALLTLGGLAYGFYKDYGAAARDVLQAGLTAQELRELAPARSPDYVLTGDIARVAAQSAIVWKAVDAHPDFELAWGRTYLGGLLTVLPASLWADKPPGKIREATILIHGRAAYLAGDRASNVFGLLGEGLMNFGLVGAPLVFVAWAWFVAHVQRLGAVLAPDDARALLLPYLTYVSVSVLTGDFDNLVVSATIAFSVPCLVVLLSSRSVHARASAGAAIRSAA